MSYWAIRWLHPTASSWLSWRQVNPVTSESVMGSNLCKLRPFSKFHTCLGNCQYNGILTGMNPYTWTRICTPDCRISIQTNEKMRHWTLIVPLRAPVISLLWKESNVIQVSSSSPCAFEIWSRLLPVSTSHTDTEESTCPVTTCLRVGLYRAQARDAAHWISVPVSRLSFLNQPPPPLLVSAKLSTAR